MSPSVILVNDEFLPSPVTLATEAAMGSPMLITARSPRLEKTRATISHVAMRLFETRGFEDVTVDEIAAEMGISRRTIFRHFPTKADIVIEPIRIGFRALPEGLRAQPTDLHIRQALAKSLDFLVAQLESRRELLARHLRLILGSSTLRAMSRTLTDEAVVDLRREIVSRAVEENTSINAAVWAEMMFVIAFGGRDRWLTHPEQPIAPIIKQSQAAAGTLIDLLRGQAEGSEDRRDAERNPLSDV